MAMLQVKLLWHYSFDEHCMCESDILKSLEDKIYPNFDLRLKCMSV